MTDEVPEALRALIKTEIKTLNADSRGRVNIGTDYADKEVRVAVLDVEGE